MKTAGRDGAKVAKQRPLRQPMIEHAPPVRGRVVIRVERCKGCEFCIEFCPQGVLACSPEINKKGYHYPIVVKDVCIQCSLCATLCPDYAIYSVPADGAARPKPGRDSE